MEFHFISFQIGEYCIGVEISKIIGVVQQKKTKENRIHLEHGSIIPVLNLHEKLQANLLETYKDVYYLVLNVKNEWVAILIDNLWGKYDVSVKCLYPLPNIFSSKYIQQVIKHKDKLILLLTADKLLE